MNTTKSYTVKEALQKLSKYCVYQDRCHQEVEQKLLSMHMIPEARATIIATLIQHNFLNEERFALNYALGKFNQKSWGKIRIKQELKKRKISVYLINKALEQIKEQPYLEKLKILTLKKYNLLGKKNTWHAKNKLKNHLLYKGYEIDLILDTINNLTKFSEI